MTSNLKQTIQEINDAFSKNDVARFLDCCNEDISWTIEGEGSLQGKSEIREFLEKHSSSAPPQFYDCRIIEEGNTAACVGKMRMKMPDSQEAVYAFCDIYEFSGGKVADLRSFCVKASTENESGGSEV
jgi:ketosteroid isomerase-like protein